MINNLTVENFQSHEKSFLAFSSGVNCIVGSSDSGKSALLRALNWIVNNRPSGDAFCSSWGGTTTASVELSDGITISRVRNSKENVYWLGDKSLKAVGKDVPEEIKEVLQITGINLQYQMDAPFLLSESPGEIARFLNQTVNLDVIHSSMKRVESIKRNAGQKADSAERDKEKFQKALENVSEKISAIEPLVSIGEELEKRISETESFISGIEKLSSSIEFVEEKISESKNFDEAERLLAECLASKEVVKKLDESISDLSSLVSGIQSIDERLEKYTETDISEKLLFKLNSQLECFDEKAWQHQQLEKIVSDIETKDEELLKIKSKIEELEEEFGDNFPDICPLCGQEVSNEG